MTSVEIHHIQLSEKSIKTSHVWKTKPQNKPNHGSLNTQISVCIFVFSVLCEREGGKEACQAVRAKVGGVDGDAPLQILWHLFHWGWGVRVGGL